MTEPSVLPEPFEDSRRLTGSNLYFPGGGAALETLRGLTFDDATLEKWQRNVQAARIALGWQDDTVALRRHRIGVSLAFTAPADQLYTATEVNEWAWWSALAFPFSHRKQLAEAEPFHAPGHAAIWDEESALYTLCAAAKAETRPALIALMQATEAHQLPFLADDDEATIGEGDGSRSWFVDELPSPDAVPWQELHAIPTALVTGSNGKTTTVRLLAAMTRAHGWRTAHSCTDGVYFDGNALEAGDFSGPTGARTALRQSKAQAAILETARGGMLRRGLAVAHANAAIVTNIAPDHFGEYGIHDLDDLATVKLVVARAIDAQGLLVLNADDPVLIRQSERLTCPLGWFALDFDLPLLAGQRAAGGATSGVRDGRLLLHFNETTHDLGDVVTMPLTLQGRATYNIANLAGAALTAAALGIGADTITATLARFGQLQSDNPGRLQHWRFGSLEVFVDYAHNPDGLRGLLHAVGAGKRTGRLAIILGHAGNREDADLRAVAATAATAHPELLVLKDIAGYERGRASGEVATIMRAQLLEDGVPAEAISTCLDEAEAARVAMAWAREGDLLVMPIHEMDAREQVTA
ncbi:MAG TPA: Mur ligase family protein, partial [Pseudoxanthomonas sp.]|nr:Mur ligase family protein [Pseudoxanthomonas sp.]